MWRWIRHRWYVVLAVIIGLMAVSTVILFARGVMTVRDYELNRPMEGAVIFDRSGEVIIRLGEQGTFVSLNQMPADLKEAIVAVEDVRFYKHKGVDLRSIVRALWVNLREGRRAQGGSTITQQLARNIFLYPQKSYIRKIEEAVLAIVLEWRYSKNQILEAYLNQIYFGEGAYGVEAAAQTYFGKPVSELDLAECALIAGLPRAPSAYSPYSNLEGARERRNVVLGRMVAAEAITVQEKEVAQNAKIELQRRTGGKARYFADYVTKYLIDELGETAVFQGGLRVHTTLDLKYQTTAEDIFQNQPYQGALVALDPKNGHILTMVGGRSYLESQFNRAVQAKRQPGSAIKPIIYAAALKEGMQMNSIVEDVPKEYAGYSPQNYGEQYWGPVTMKHAIALSLNNAAVWTLNKIGVAKGFAFAQEVGLKLVNEDRNLALALGGITEGVSPLAMAGAYVPFANGGLFHPPTSILRVIDSEGNEVMRFEEKPQTVLTNEQAYLMTNMLEAVLDYGTGKNVDIARPAAAKTGTTNENVDLWFIGYTPDLVTCIFIGNDNRKPIEGYGSSTAGPMWAEYMEKVLKDRSKQEFSVPANVETGVLIDVFTGLLATERCEYVELDAFAKGTKPTRYAPCALPPKQITPKIPLTPLIPEEPPTQPMEPILPERPEEVPVEPTPTTPEVPPEVPVEPVPEEPVPEPEEPGEPSPETPEEPQKPSTPEQPPQTPQKPAEPQPKETEETKNPDIPGFCILRFYRLENCGALRAFFKPYFFLSFIRGSRVR